MLLSPATIGAIQQDPIRRTFRQSSLDLRFADNKSLVDATTGASLVTFTRASTGTYVGSDGLIMAAVTNLLLRSEEFDNASWTKSNSSIGTNVVTAPNGSLTADKLIEDTANTTHLVYAGSSALTAGQPYVVSVYLKAAERTFASIGSVTSNSGTGINLSTGTLVDVTVAGWTNAATRSVTNIGNGWYRVAVVIPSATGNNSLCDSIRIFTNNGTTTSYTGDGTSGIYVWGAQLEQSATVGEYIPTTSTINSAPRFDHNPTTGESLGLLVEEARTNLVRNNTMVGAVAGSPGTPPTNGWVIVNNATYASSILGTGTENGINYIDIQYVVAAAAPASTLFYCDTPAASALTAYTGSYYLKLISGTIPQVRFIWQDGISTYNRTFFTLTATLTRYTDTLTTAILANLARFAVGIDAAPSGATFVIRVGLPQVEQGAFATSPILTSTATATRAADVASVTGANFSSWYNQTEGTLYWEGVIDSALPSGSFGQFFDFRTDGSNRLSLYWNPTTTNNVGLFVMTGGVTQVTTQHSLGTNAQSKLSGAYKVNDFASSLSGSVVQTDTSGTLPASTVASIGSAGAAGVLGQQRIRRLTYWPVRLPNPTLQSITQ